MYELAEKSKASTTLPEHNKAVAKAARASRFWPGIDDKVEVQELRSFKQKKQPAMIRFFKDPLGVMVAAGLLPGVPIILVGGIMTPGPAGLAMAIAGATVTTGAIGGLLSPVLFIAKEARLERATKGHREELSRELTDWLRDVYGLSITDSYGFAEFVKDTIARKGGGSQVLSFKTAEGSELNASIVPQANGFYRLRKATVSDISEDPYIAPLAASKPGPAASEEVEAHV